jgi:hypothetical protein
MHRLTSRSLLPTLSAALLVGCGSAATIDLGNPDRDALGNDDEADVVCHADADCPEGQRCLFGGADDVISSDDELVGACRDAATIPGGIPCDDQADCPEGMACMIACPELFSDDGSPVPCTGACGVVGELPGDDGAGDGGQSEPGSPGE